MFSLAGEVLGINTFKYFEHTDGRAAEGLGFAIPVSTVREQVARLEKGVFAEDITLDVSPGQEIPITFGLRVGSSLAFRFQSSTDVNFRLHDPLGAEIVRSDRTLAERGTLVADTEGTYTLVFDNSFSFFTNKIVNLSYVLE